MSIQANIIGHVCLGGGVSKYSSFKINICANGLNWTIFRRYSEFRRFFEKLVLEIGDRSVKFAKISLPEKEHYGSYGSTFDVVISKRISYLQEFLNSVCTLDHIESVNSLKLFFDFENHGLSGLSMEIGANRVLRETFAKTHYTSYPFVDVGDRTYIVLTKAGSLYILQSIYSSAAHAKLMISVTATDIEIRSRGNRSVDIFCSSTNKHLVIKFSSSEELYVWLRDLNDFTLQDIPSAEAKREEKTNSKRYSKKKFEDSKTNSSETPIESSNTAKLDEMSAEYGI